MSGDKAWRQALSDIETTLQDHGWYDTLVASPDARQCIVRIERIRVRSPSEPQTQDALIVERHEDRAIPWSFRAVRDGDSRSLRGSDRFDLKLLLGGIFDAFPELVDITDPIAVTYRQEFGQDAVVRVDHLMPCNLRVHVQSSRFQGLSSLERWGLLVGALDSIKARIRTGNSRLLEGQRRRIGTICSYAPDEPISYNPTPTRTITGRMSSTPTEPPIQNFPWPETAGGEAFRRTLREWRNQAKTTSFLPIATSYRGSEADRRALEHIKELLDRTYASLVQAGRGDEFDELNPRESILSRIGFLAEHVLGSGGSDD